MRQGVQEAKDLKYEIINRERDSVYIYRYDKNQEVADHEEKLWISYKNNII